MFNMPPCDICQAKSEPGQASSSICRFELQSIARDNPGESEHGCVAADGVPCGTKSTTNVDFDDLTWLNRINVRNANGHIWEELN
jgi:hypothetical protein